MDARTPEKSFVVVVQTIMQYGSETWVITLSIGRVLCGFHHRVFHRITGKQPQRRQERGWVYPPLEDAMAKTGLQEVETNVSRCHN